ncbi:hypothetical protein AMECASPLE_017066 [Ameca splendens]|uniref:Uncharacterized protein n=1 Tax=Ameca splendens TaxID=208324 RepID=A0ABV0XRE7_9TELE
MEVLFKVCHMPCIVMSNSASSVLTVVYLVLFSFCTSCFVLCTNFLSCFPTTSLLEIPTCNQLLPHHNVVHLCLTVFLCLFVFYYLTLCSFLLPVHLDTLLGLNFLCTDLGLY